MKCSRAEFMQLTGIHKAHLSTYIKRGKIILDPDGKTIDTENPANADFVKSQALKQKEKLQAVKEIVSIPKTPEVVIPPLSPPIKVSSKVKKVAEQTTISKYALELEKMQAELDKKIVDTRLAEQKLSILLGNNIPIDLVKSIIAQLSKSMITNYKSFSEQQINEFCHQFGIGEADRVKLTAKNTTGLNQIHNKAIKDAETQMKNAMGKNKLKESQSNEDEDGD